MRYVVLVLLAVLSGCSSYAPDAGHQVVLTYKPLIWGHGGIDPEPVMTGRVYTAISTDGVDINMQPQRFDVAQDDTMTRDGVPVGFHAVAVLPREHY